MDDRAERVPTQTPCLRCGYDLGGLALRGESAFCPECGWRFGESFARQAVMVPVYLKACRLRLAWWIVAWLLIVLAFVVLGMRAMSAGWLAITTGLLIASILGFILLSNGFWRGHLGSRAFFRAYWLDNLWMLLLPMVCVEVAVALRWIVGREVVGMGLLLWVWAALVVVMPNVFMWRLHVLQMRMGVSNTMPASSLGLGALLAIFMSVLGLAALTI